MENEIDKLSIQYWLEVNYPVIADFFVKETVKRTHRNDTGMMTWPAAGRRGTAVRWLISNNSHRDMMELYNYVVGEIA
jgi:hypothetical protein